MTDATIDLEYTYDAPRVELVHPAQLDALRAANHALSVSHRDTLAQLDAARRIRHETEEAYTTCAYALVEQKATADKLRADVDLLCGYIRAVLDGMTVAELAALADVVEEVEQRHGLGEKGL